MLLKITINLAGRHASCLPHVSIWTGNTTSTLVEVASAFFSPRAVSYSLCHFFHGANGEQLSTAGSRTADHWDLSPKSNLFGAKPTPINLASCSLPMLPFPHACMKWTCCHKANSTAPQQQPACLFLHCCKHHVTHSSREQLAWRGDAESALSFSSQCMTGADLHEVVGCSGRRAARTTTSGSPLHGTWAEMH